ncbi:MAG: hypothetical protein NVSMB26_23170 [Beijerinckiaceae bacterium]
MTEDRPGEPAGRASIDGRVAFAAAFLVLGCGLIMLLDRIGVPERLVALIGPLLALVSLATLGALLHSMRISRFYVAGRRMPAIYAGLAGASLVAALAAAYLAALPAGVSLLDFALGLFAGAGFAGLGVGPLIRKTGAFSIPDLIAARFPNTILRLALALLIAVIALALACAGLETAVRALTLWSGLSRPLAAALIGIVLVFVATPGGYSGAIWASTAAGGIFIAAFALPLGLYAVRGNPLPLPVFGDAPLWQSATARLGDWGLLGTNPGAIDLAIIAAATIGAAVLIPLVAPAFAAPDRGSARRGGIAALVFICLFAGLAVVTIAASALSLGKTTLGQKPDRLSASIYAASRSGTLSICGATAFTPTSLRQACAARPGFADALRESDIVPEREFLFANLPSLAGLGSAFSGLAAAALATLGIALASIGFHAFATALGHDAFYRVRDAGAVTSRRLAITRLILIGAITMAAVVASSAAIDPRAAIALALVLSAAAVAPLVALVLWPRATAFDALATLITGIVAMEAVTVLGGALTSGWLAGAALTGGVLGFVAGIASSIVRSGDTEIGAAFVRAILRGKTEIPNLDRGA